MDARRKRSARKWALGCGLAVLVCLVLAAGAYALYLYSLSSQVRAKLDAIREAGHPVALAELNEWYEDAPPGENAALIFLAAFRLYARDEEKEGLLPVLGGVELPPLGEPLPQDMTEAVAEYLAENEHALDVLRAAAAFQSFRYPVDLSLGLQVPLPHLKHLRHGARLLQLEAILHSEKGRTDEAIGSVFASLGLARSLATEPTIISHLTRIVCLDRGILALERLVSRTQLTGEQLVRVSAALARGVDRKAVYRALVGDRCAVSALFRETYSLPEISLDTVLVQRALGLWDKDHLFFLDLMTRAVEASQLPLPLRVKTRKALAAEFSSLPRYRQMLRQFGPQCDAPLKFDTNSIAYIRAARAALAVERYRLAKGELPEKLADLVPGFLDSVPEDPFDGHPLRYKKLERGYVVYSIGEDEKDEGGEAGHPTWPDVPFTVAR